MLTFLRARFNRSIDCSREQSIDPIRCYRITLYCHCEYFQGDRKHCQSNGGALPNIRDSLFYGVYLKPQISNLKSTDAPYLTVE
ncbi:MAG: hypothetical protein ICV52_14065 [Microcoleus sp. C1-bin4]|nr:hypothetical protein [Microcoleus sp. C1-bin4]